MLFRRSSANFCHGDCSAICLRSFLPFKWRQYSVEPCDVSAHDRLDEVLLHLERHKNVRPISRDAVYDLLQVCTRRKDLLAARQVQCLMVKGRLDTISVLADHLIRLFTLCGSLLDADNAFHRVIKPTVYTWNSIIAAHVKLGKVYKALDLFKSMQSEGVIPDKVTFLCIFKVCGILKAVNYGRLAHFLLLTGDSKLLADVGNMLVDMYAKFGHLEEGHKVFSGLNIRDVISWGALMTGYAQEGRNHTVLRFFQSLHSDNVKPNKVVFLAVLKSCAGMSAIKQGLLTHVLLIENEESIDMAVGSSLVDMYGKCGHLVEAHHIFDALPDKDVKSWGAIMAGYSAQGSCTMVEWCLRGMKSARIKPDKAIFTSILACYSHAGILCQGYAHFYSMTLEYDIKPCTEHYNCMADLLGRAGYLKEAKFLLDNTFNQENLVGWLSLLTNCKTYNNPSIGKLCFLRVIELEPTEARGYMLMSNIYANAGMLHEVAKVQELRRKARAWKKPGISTIEVNNKSYDFFVGAKYDFLILHMDERLVVQQRDLRREGYVPQLEVVL